jgi:hypothetical protein
MQFKAAVVVEVGMAAALDHTVAVLVEADLAMSAEFLMSLISLEITQSQIQMERLRQDAKDLVTRESLIHCQYLQCFSHMHSLDLSPKEHR